MYNNNDIGDRVPPSIKLERKQIREKTIREKNEELEKKMNYHSVPKNY